MTTWITFKSLCENIIEGILILNFYKNLESRITFMRLGHNTIEGTIILSDHPKLKINLET